MPSLTVYQQKGRRLRFSRSGEPKIEEAYSTHLVVLGKRNPFAAEDCLLNKSPENLRQPMPNPPPEGVS